MLAFPSALDAPTAPRTPLAAPPRPTRSRPRPVPPPIRAAPWLRSLALLGGGWQDSRAAHDSRGPCSERCPFLARSSRGVSSDGGLRGFSDTWHAYLAKASSFRMHGVRILPGRGDFPVRGPFWDTWSEKNCHGLPPGNASRRNLATAKRLGTHLGTILPPSDAEGTHFAGILSSTSARERIWAQSCHRHPANTPMKNLHNRHLTIVYKALTRNQAEYNKEIGF